MQPAECCPLPMVRDTFLSFLLSFGVQRLDEARKTSTRGGRKRWRAMIGVTPPCRIGLFAGYQKGLRLLAQAASTFARE